MKYVVVLGRSNRRNSAECHVVSHMYRIKKNADKRARYLNEHDPRTGNNNGMHYYVRAMRMQTTIDFWNGVQGIIEFMQDWKYDRLMRKIQRMEAKYAALQRTAKRLGRKDSV